MTKSQHQISRRLALGAGLGGTLIGLTGLPAKADSPFTPVQITPVQITPAQTPSDTLDPELFGPASLTGAAMGASFQGDRVYVLSRYGNPTPLFGVFDLTTNTMLNVVSLPAGTGGYTLASNDDHVYLGLTNDPHVWDYDVAAGTIRALATVGLPVTGRTVCASARTE